MKNLALAKLQALSKANLLPHAWLFVGSDLAPQQQLALQFSAWLLCESPQELACGTCKACSMLAASSHPDFCVINPQEDKQTILVDDVRELNIFLNKKAQFANYKIVLLYPADNMNLAAANALLKSLEEPGANSLVILLCSNPNLLLKTIVSRCQQLNFNVTHDASASPVPQEIRQVLSDLKDLYVEQRLTSIELVESLVKRWPNEVLYWFELALADLLVCIYTDDHKFLRYPELYVESQALAAKIGVTRLWQMLTKVQRASCSLGAGQRPNLQLLLEDVVL